MTVHRSFALNRRSVAASRAFIGDALGDLPDDLREAAVLMMSELATNAIVHAGTGFEVAIDRSPETLRVAVADVGGGEPELRTPSSSEPHGRGLQIVTHLADEWGMSDNDDRLGKTVWYVIRLDRPQLSGSRGSSVRDDMPRQSAAQTRQQGHQQPNGDARRLEAPGDAPHSSPAADGRADSVRYDGPAERLEPHSFGQATVARPSSSVSMSSACSSSTARISSSMRRVVGSPVPSQEMISL